MSGRVDDSSVADTADGDVRRPAALPGAAVGGAVIGLILLVLVGLAVRDLLVRAGWVTGGEWLRGATHWGTEVGWQTWMWPVAVVLVLVGLGLLWVSVKPRRQRHLPIGDGGVLWTRPVDVARRCSAAVGDLPGVESATTAYGRRRVAVRIVGDRSAVDVDAVAQTVRAVLTDLRAEPKVTVKVIDRVATKES